MENIRHALCDGCAQTFPQDWLELSLDGSEKLCSDCREKDKENE